MVGGNSSDIGVPGAGGVAPFVPCDGELQDNVMSFVFSAETNNLDYLCWAAAQETSARVRPRSRAERDGSDDVPDLRR